MLKVKKLKGKSVEEDFEEIYSKCLKEVHELPEYKQNEMQINSIKKVLVNSGDVPEKLILWLIESVKNNTQLEYLVAHKEFLRYLKLSKKRWLS